ncbi:MAG: hypothetical protein WCK67_01195 [bacterium]
MKPVENNDKINIITVVNKFDIYNKVIRDNNNVNHYPITVFDNRTEHSSISKIYNNFISEKVYADSDFWCVFIHQDFGFNHDPYIVLADLDKNFIYGATGVNKYTQKLSFVSNRFRIKKLPVVIGQIKQIHDENNFSLDGLKLDKPEIVQTLDCCCLIVHSSLLNKYKLKFDENLTFHMYAEEFSINAKKTYNIDTKAVQFDCYHIGRGHIDEEFKKSVAYVKNKHKIRQIVSTTISYH